MEPEIEMVKIRSGETKEILFTKSNLNLISTVEDHCVSDDTDRVTRNECLIKLVRELKHPFFEFVFMNFNINQTMFLGRKISPQQI